MAPTPNTKNNIKFQLPSFMSSGPINVIAPMTSATRPNAMNASFNRAKRKTWMMPTSSISPSPMGNAAARQEFGMPIAGVVTNASSEANS